MQNSKPMTLASFAGTGVSIVGGTDGVPRTVIETPKAFDGMSCGGTMAPFVASDGGSREGLMAHHVAFDGDSRDGWMAHHVRGGWQVP